MKSLFAAISFLTVFRIPAAWYGDERALARSLTWFPIVGLLIGCLVAAFDAAMCEIFPGLLVPSALSVIAMVAVSGGFHLDGLADSADAFMSSRPKEQMLEIMKDSRCGPMGVLAIISTVLLKFAALASLVSDWRASTIILMPLAGRSALVIMTTSLDYVRDNGLVTLFQAERRWWQTIVALLLLGMTSCLSFGFAGVLIVFAVLVITSLFALFCRARIGGLTGDTLGATCELVEIVPVLVALPLVHLGLVI